MQYVQEIGDDGTTTLLPTVLSYSDGLPQWSSPVNFTQIPPNVTLGDSNVVRMMDMNGDGLMDIVRSSSNRYDIYFNTSNGTGVSFQSSIVAVNSPNVTVDNVNVRLVDINGDGLLDVLYGPGNPYKYWINNGVNGFNPPVLAGNCPTSSLSQNQVHIVDMNGDGFGDILATSAGSYKIYFNNGNNNFNAPITAQNSPPASAGSTEIQFGEFNGDGILDIIYGQSNNYRLWINNGQNGFKAPVAATNYPPSLSISNPLVQLADMNGDGLTDILRTFSGQNKQYYIYYNNGKTNFNNFIVANNPPNLGTDNQHVKVLDVNADRFPDVMVGDRSQGAPYKVWLNDGSRGFLAPITLAAYPTQSLNDANTMLGDIDGDGLTDIIQGNQNNFKTWRQQGLEQGGRVGSLLDVDNTFGGHLEIEYQDVPVKGLGGSSYKVVNSPTVFSVVKEIRRTTGFGQTYVSRYDLKDALWDHGDREYRGFKNVKMIDPDGNYTFTEFAQGDVYKGRALKQETYDSLNRLFAKTVNSWQSQQVYSNVNFIFLRQADQYVYDGNATGRRTQAQYFYDETPQYGNLTKTIQLGEVDLAAGTDTGSDKRTVEIAYLNNTQSGKWLLGLPKQKEIKDNSGAVVRRSWFYYDGSTDLNALPSQGFLTKQSDWAGDAPGTVHPATSYTYDNIGNLVSTQDPEGNTTTITFDTTYRLFPLTTANAATHTVTNEYYGVNGVALQDAEGFHGLWGHLKSTTDPNGQKGRKIYDPNGRLSAVVSPLDSVDYPTVSMQYIDASYWFKVITKQRINHGAAGSLDTAEFYDGLGRLLQTKTPSETAGQNIVSGQTEYDLRGLPVKQYLPAFTSQPLTEIDPINPSAPFTMIQYDAMGRAVRTIRPDGPFADAAYEDWTATSVDENGHMQKSYFDAYGRLIKKEEYLGADGRDSHYPQSPYTLYATTLYTYDSEGNLTQTQDAHGNITTIAYDKLGRKTGMNDPDMGDWQYEYDINGNLLAQTDAKQQQLDFVYDNLNRLTDKTGPFALNVSYLYDTIESGFGKGRLGQVQYGAGTDQTGFEYDALGREVASVKTIGSQSYQVNRSYDALNRLVSLEYPDTTQLVYIYNGAGQIEQVKIGEIPEPPPGGGGGDPVLLESPFTQLRLNENSSSTVIADAGTGHNDGQASVATSSLSSAGKINAAYRFNGTSQYGNVDAIMNDLRTDTVGTFTMWVKPELGGTFLNFNGSAGYFTMEWFKNNQSASFAISGAGTPISCTTAGGSVPGNVFSHIAFVQDGTGVRIYVNGVQQTLTYWFNSNPAAWFSFLSANGLQTGRMGAARNHADPSAYMDYLQGTIDDVRYYKRALTLQEILAIYNNDTGTEEENPPIPEGAFLRQDERDGPGATELASGEVPHQGWKAFKSRLQETVAGFLDIVLGVDPAHAQVTEQIFINDVDYNAAGQITRVEYGNGVVTDYTYDPENLRLTRLKTTDPQSAIIQDLQYTYDGVGNIMEITDAVHTASQTFAYDALNRLTAATGDGYGSKNYQYDEIGNIIQKDGLTYTYGQNGAGPHAVTSLSDGSVFQYDANGNMTVRQQGGVMTEYLYDAENRLAEVRRDSELVAKFEYDGDGGRTKKILYDNGALTKEFVFVGGLYEETDGAGTNYIYLGDQRVAAVKGGEESFYHGDHLGGTNVVTDWGGVIKEVVEYSPYGEFSRHDDYSAGQSVEHYFTGQRLDDEVGLYYYGARYYDAGLGRFITADSIVPGYDNPQAFNRYSYALNNPINRVDPSGHWSFKKFWKAAVGAFIGAVAGIIAGPAGLALVGATMAGVIGGAVGGAVTGGLEAGWRGALFGALGGGALGGIGAWGISEFGWQFGAGMLIAGAGAAGATDRWDSFIGGLTGGIAGGLVANAWIQSSQATGTNGGEAGATAEKLSAGISSGEIGEAELMAMYNDVRTNVFQKVAIAEVVVEAANSAVDFVPYEPGLVDVTFSDIFTVVSLGRAGPLSKGLSATKGFTGGLAAKLTSQLGFARISKGITTNQINQLIQTGKAPSSILRVDLGKILGEQAHVHFKKGAALNIDGSWKHGFKVLNNAEKDFLKKVGWKIHGE
ncbi:MAG: toxin TcdB middle/N-terminal domain-containing protein [Candidatus Omnitrophota bacterium]|nr:toxin TcdB middle/N-terminal domain-containing protein [Candidatus Omnitrophota bacterium]